MSNKTQLTKLALRSLFLASLIPLAGCVTTGIGTAPSQADLQKVACSPWRAISYSQSKDTSDTVSQIRMHNRTGQNLKCWK